MRAAARVAQQEARLAFAGLLLARSARLSLVRGALVSIPVPLFGLLLALVVVDLAGAVFLKEGAVDGLRVVVGNVGDLGGLRDGVMVPLDQVDE